VVLEQIDRVEKNAVELLHKLRQDTRSWFAGQMWRCNRPKDGRWEPPVVGFERQITGDVNGWLQMLVQMAIWDGLLLCFGSNLRMVAPYPPQLKKYAHEVHGLQMVTKSQIRQTYFERAGTFGYVGVHAPSSHRIEAHLLALMAKDVVGGRWSFEQKPTTPILAPWRLLTGAD
jgi:hypothetical protein